MTITATTQTSRRGMSDTEVRFEELTGLRMVDVYSNKTYNPKNRHIGLRNGLIFHINRLAKDRILAEEIADEVLTRVIFEKLETYDPTLANFPTWLFQIGKHEIMAYRNRQRLKATDQEKFVSLNNNVNLTGESGVSLLETLVCDDVDSITSSERDDMMALKHQIVKKAIFSLDEKKSSALAMRLLDGLRYNEITDYTGENLNTIKSRIKQGKAAVVRKVRKDFRTIDQQYS